MDPSRCPALGPSQALPSSETEAHTQPGSGPETISIPFNVFPENLLCARPGPNVRGMESKQPSCQPLLPGSRSSLVPGVPRRKTLQPDKAGQPRCMSARALLPRPGPAVHPLSQGERLPSSPASVLLCGEALPPSRVGWKTPLRHGGATAQLSASCAHSDEG